MKIGLLSDIHGNADALAAVLASARRLDVQRILCSGDIVGYYYEPDKCLELLSEWEVECVRGNHEDMLFGLINTPSLGPQIKTKYGSGLYIAAAILTTAQLEYLYKLPVHKTIKIQGKTFLLCHGSPWETDQYIYPDAEQSMFRRCAEGGNDYVVLGHTHHQLKAVHGNTLIVNPGSVGQPRGRDRGFAHWAVLDTQNGLCQHQTTAYDLSSVISQAQKYDPDVSYLRSILTKD